MFHDIIIDDKVIHCLWKEILSQ